MQNKYLKEIQDLNQSLAAFKAQTEAEVAQLRGDKAELGRKCEYYETDIRHLKLKLGKVKEKLGTMKEDRGKKAVQERAVGEGEAVLRYKQKIQGLKQQVSKWEQTERRLKNMLIEKENEYEQQMIEMKRIVN